MTGHQRRLTGDVALVVMLLGIEMRGGSTRRGRTRACDLSTGLGKHQSW